MPPIPQAGTSLGYKIVFLKTVRVSPDGMLWLLGIDPGAEFGGSMADDEKWPPHAALAIALGVVGCVWALCWAAPHVLHALSDVFVAAITAWRSGFSSAVPVASWVVPAASAGIAAAGVGTVTIVLVKAAKEATDKPEEWTLPILGLIGALFLDLSKEFAIDNTFIKAALTAATAFLVVVAGACWRRKDWLWRSVAVVLILFPPIAVLLRNLDRSKLTITLQEVPVATQLRLGGFVLIGIVVAILHRLAQRHD
jgi:hypothetical protein